MFFLICWENIHTLNLGNVKRDSMALSCEECHEELDDVPCLLVHLGAHKAGADVTCNDCNHTLGTLSVSDFAGTMRSFYTIQSHFYSKVHLNDSRNETKLEAVENFCDVCDETLKKDSITTHCQGDVHNQNIVMIKEYLVYCRARDIDPVNHTDFQAFIFFLRYIYSLSVSLQLTMKHIMKVVSKIHTNFNKLLNVNESIDVTDEVINKLSATEPSMFFCFPCFEGFMTPSESCDHLKKGNCERIRCCDCKVDLDIDNIEEHSHEENSDQIMNNSTCIIPKLEKISHEERNGIPGAPAVMQNIALEGSPLAEEMEITLEEKSGEKKLSIYPNIDVLPAKYFNPTFKYKFDAKIPEDSIEKHTCDISLPDILKNKVNQNRVKNIVDHCVEKRKKDPTLIEYPLSHIRYKKLRMDARLNLDSKEAKYQLEPTEKTDNEEALVEDEEKGTNEFISAPEPSIVHVTTLDIEEFKKEEDQEDNEQFERSEKFQDIIELPSHDSTKIIEGNKQYQPMKLDIKICDVAFVREWEEILGPQIDYLKKKAEVFNRWKNDINFYKNMI